MAETFIRRRKSSIPSCSVLYRQTVSQKNLLHHRRKSEASSRKAGPKSQQQEADRIRSDRPGVFVLCWIHSRRTIFALERAKSFRGRKNRRAAVQRVTFLFLISHLCGLPLLCHDFIFASSPLLMLLNVHNGKCGRRPREVAAAVGKPER